MSKVITAMVTGGVIGMVAGAAMAPQMRAKKVSKALKRGRRVVGQYARMIQG